MMNPNGHAPGPLYHGRRDMPYNPPPQQPYYQNPYHGYHNQHQHAPQHFPQQPQQWQYYNMQPPMPRTYQQPYPPMMNAPYPVGQPPSMSPRPNPAHHVPPSPAIRPHHSMMPTPPAQDRSLQSPPHPPMPVVRSSPTTPSTVTRRVPFYPPLPWYSVPVTDFPARSSKRKTTFAPQSPNLPVELPALADGLGSAKEDGKSHAVPATGSDLAITQTQTTPIADTGVDTSMASPEVVSTQPTTSSSAAPPRAVISTSHNRQPSKILPVVPIISNLPALARQLKKPAGSLASDVPKSSESVSVLDSENAAKPVGTPSTAETTDSVSSENTSKPASQTPPAPKSWADLVRSRAPASNTGIPAGICHAPPTASGSGLSLAKVDSKVEVVLSFDVANAGSDSKISFLKPRGLINTGNMCYMNSVLQMLVFCVPFYDFLDQVRKHAAHNFNSDTPMVDAMIMFIREFPIIDSATSAEQLNLRLKDKELEEYGESFTPEFVYDVIRRLPRFSSMRRGHQQDAEEFLGFLLEEMHEECARVMKGTAAKAEEASLPITESFTSEGNGWLEVGPKQKAAITRSSGIVEADSPITKIFGGKLRSELRVPGAKNSVTLESYQPLQLDIGSPQINNITEALKGLTRSETLHGDFNSPRGPLVSATKQVFVETLPPVLILHLKRFQYDNAGGTQKIWKKVGYPLELEIPKEVFPPHKRGGLAAHGGLPKYRLIGVVYHHGKNASGGHYTVDVRRQNDREWIRLDDTVIRRVRSEDVAEGGGEEDPKVLAAALEQHKRDESSSSNIFDQVREEKEQSSQADKGWSQVNGATTLPSTKKWSGVVDGNAMPAVTSSGKGTPLGRNSVKDNKVAYILFYQKIGL